MTREEAIALRPDSAASYWIVLILCGIFGLLLLPLPLLRTHTHPPDGWATLVFALAMLALAWQAYERLFQPIRAANRTARLSPQTRSILSMAKLALPILVVVVFGLDLIRGRHISLGPLGWSLLMFAHLCADLLGESLNASRVMRRSPSTIHWSDWQTIHSDHWGER
jgi:hypothetical protein